MEDRPVDRVARALAATGSRRAVVSGLLAAIGIVASAPGGQAGARCKIVGRRCRRHRQCCTRNCRHGRCRRRG